MASWARTIAVAAAAAATSAVATAMFHAGRLESARERDRGEVRAREDRDRAAVADLTERLARLQGALDQAHRELAIARAEAKRAAAAPAPVPPPGPSKEVPVAAAERLAAAVRAALEKKDGSAVMAALRELAAVVPDGRAPAMGLVAEFYEAKDDLGIGDVAWGAFLAAPAVTDLLAWSIGHPSPEGFRELAAEVLPELTPPDAVTALYRDALKTEKDEDVSRAMVEGLIALKTAGADAVLLDLFRDARAPVPVRVQIATHFGSSGNSRDVLQAALEGAPPALAAGIRAALSAPEVQANGFLITGFVDGSLRNHNLEVGDVILSYDGRRADEELNPAIRGALGRDGTVKVEVLRAGARETVEVKPGWLGLIGLVVHGREGR